MKKLLTLFLLSFLFIGCSSDDEDNTVYIDNKLIEGSWYWIQASDSTVYTFKNNAATQKVYDKYTLDMRQEFGRGSYKLTPDRIECSWQGKDLRIPYQLQKDTLFIMESANGVYTKYIRVK